VIGMGAPSHLRRLAGDTTRAAARLRSAATLAHGFDHGARRRGQVTAAPSAPRRPCPRPDRAQRLAAETPA